MLQETVTTTPSLPGYKAHISPAQGRSVCTLVGKGLTFVEHKVKQGRMKAQYTFTENIPCKQRKVSSFLLNIYSNQKHPLLKFRSLFHKVRTHAKGSLLVIGGDFNAPHTAWGCVRDSIKGRYLLESALENECALITDPANPTRIGNSVARDTTPDLTFVQNDTLEKTTWKNTGVDLGSDHYIVEITIPGQLRGNHTQHKWTDWERFRQNQHDERPAVKDIGELTSELRVLETVVCWLVCSVR